MFKRVERKRKRREEEEELGLDEDAKELMGLNDTDSDESDSESGQSDADQEDGEASEDDRVDEESPISVAEALKDPIYLVTLDPTVHGCVLCRGKLMKNAGMSAAHKNANAHKRRFEHFRALADGVDPHSNAWELVRSIRSVQTTQPQALSKRALKRQVKQATIREKRKRHKELKAKAIAKKASKKLSTAANTSPLEANTQSLPVSQVQSGKPRKKQKLEKRASTSTPVETRVITAKSASRTKVPNDNKKRVVKSRLKSTRNVNPPS